MKSLQIPNKLKGKEILNRKTKVTQPSSQLASNCPQHKNVDEKERQVPGGDATSGPANGSVFPVLRFFTPLASFWEDIKGTGKGLRSLAAIKQSMRSVSRGIDPVDYAISPCLHPPRLPHCRLSFPPTELPQGSFHAAVPRCQVPNPLSGLLREAAAFWIPASWSRLGYGYLGSARSSQSPACLMPTAAPMARCYPPHPSVWTLSRMKDLRRCCQDQGMSKARLFLPAKPPLLILFTWAAALADLGEDWGGILVMSSLQQRSTGPPQLQEGVSLNPWASSRLFLRSSY